MSKNIVQEPSWTLQLGNLLLYPSLIDFLLPQCFSASNLNIRVEPVCCISDCHNSDYEECYDRPCKKGKGLKGDLLQIIFYPITWRNLCNNNETYKF